METAQLHWQVFLPSLYSEALLFLLCYLLFLSCMSLRSLALSSWHLRESFLEGTGWLLLQSSRTTSPSGWRGSVLLASSHSPWLPWCPFTKPVLFMYAFLILNRGRGRGIGTLEPVFQKQSECQVKDNRCALSLLSSVLINRAEDAVGLPCFQVMLLAPVWLLPTKILGGSFQQSCPLDEQCQPVQHQGLFLPVQKTVVLLNSIRFLSACSPACPGPSEWQPCCHVCWLVPPVCLQT